MNETSKQVNDNICPICKIKFSVRSELIRHLNRHRFIEEVGGKNGIKVC